MNETNARGVRWRPAETVAPVHNEAHVLPDSPGTTSAYSSGSSTISTSSGLYRLDASDVG